MSNFHPLEVVGRGSETQLQVGEKLNYFFITMGEFSVTVIYCTLVDVKIDNENRN